MPVANSTLEELPRYETARRLESELDLSLVEDTNYADLPTGVDLYLVFLEPRAL